MLTWYRPDAVNQAVSIDRQWFVSVSQSKVGGRSRVGTNRLMPRRPDVRACVFMPGTCRDLGQYAISQEAWSSS